MPWSWRGKYFTATRAEYERVKAQLEYESVKDAPVATTSSAASAYNKPRYGSDANKPLPINFSDLKEEDQATRIKARVKAFSHRVRRATMHIM